MKRVRLLVLAGLVSASVLFALPAEAHNQAVYHGNDHATTTDFHTVLWACDQESDGNGVRAHWRDFNGNVTVGSWDPDGAYGICARNSMPSNAVEIRICENNVGCSGWIPK